MNFMSIKSFFGFDSNRVFLVKFTLKFFFMRLVKIIVVGVYVFLLTVGSSSILDNPDKDKLLIEVIAYVMQRGHYDPK